METIQYAIDTETGLIISRVGNELAWPILDFEGMLSENHYAMNYSLEKMHVFAASSVWYMLKWTRKIPKETKNIHRKFWRFPELKS